jgi:SLT domain-containing protein
MARFEMGSAWVSVHADTSAVDNEVRKATEEASKKSSVTVKVEADQSKLEAMNRKLDQLGNTAQQAGLRQERAQLNVNKAQESYNSLLQNSNTSENDRARAINTVAMAQAKLEAASQRVLDIERQRSQVSSKADNLEASIRVTLDTATADAERERLKEKIDHTDATIHVTVDQNVNRDTDRVGSALASAFDGIGSKIGKTLTKFLSDGLEQGVQTGMKTFATLTEAGESAAASVGTALAATAGEAVATDGINLLIQAVLGLAAAIPIVIVGFLALAPALMVAAGAFGAAEVGVVALVSVMGTLKLAFGGISDALKGYEQDQDKASAASSKNAATELSNAIAIRNAETSVADARRTAARAAVAAAQQVSDAQKSLKQAELDAATRVKEAQESLTKTVQDSADRIKDSQERLAEAHEDAADRITEAEKKVADAKDNAREAEDKLSEARATAKKRLDDLKYAARDAAEDESRAAFKVQEAQHDLDVINSHLALGTSEYTDWDRTEALEKLREAQVDYADAQKKSTTAQTDSNVAAAAGVEGDKNVVAAKKSVVKANEDVTDAQNDLTKAQTEAAKNITKAEKDLADARKDGADQVSAAEKAIAKAKSDGARSVASAQEALAKAQTAQKQSTEDGNRSIARAVQALVDLKAQQKASAQAAREQASASSAYQKAMDQLPPSAQALVKQLIAMKKYLDELKKTASDALLPHVTQFLKDSVVLFPIINAHIGNMGTILGGVVDRLGAYIKTPLFQTQLRQILGGVEGFVTSIGDAVTKAIPALVTIAAAASPILEKIGGWISAAAGAFANWIESSRRSGQLKTFFDDVGHVFDQLALTGKLVFQIIGDVIKILFGPSKDASGTFLDGVNGLLERIHLWLSDPKNQQALKDLYQKFKDFMEKVFTKENVKAVLDFFTNAKDFMKWVNDSAIPKIKQWKAEWDLFMAPFKLSTYTNAFKDFSASVKGKLGELEKSFGDTIASVKSKWKDFWETGLGAKMKTEASKIKTNVGQWWTDIKTNFSNSTADAKNKFSTWWGDLKTLVGTKGGPVKTAISTFTSNVKTTLSDGWTNAKNNFGAFWSNLKSTADSWATKVKAVFTGIKTHVGQVFGGLTGVVTNPMQSLRTFLNKGISAINVVLPKSLDVPLIPKFATGGHVTGPGGETADQIPAMLSHNEYVLPAKVVRQIGVGNLDRLRRGEIGLGGDPYKARAAFADGGLVTKTQTFIKSTDPLPYIFGAVGPRGYDCSGLTGEVMNRLTGHASYQRRFTTGSNFESVGFKKGRGAYTIGVDRGAGHMVGNLAGLPFEAASTRSGIKVGSNAKSVTAMPQQYYLPQVAGSFIGSGSNFAGIGALVGNVLGQVGSLVAGIASDGLMRAPKGIGQLAKDKVQARINQATGFLSNVGNDVKTWAGGAVSAAKATGWVGQAMLKAGVYAPKWLTGMLTLTKRESNWNPNAVNNWDSNARAGHPSKGIAQMIDSTFAAHAIPGLGGIFDPVANIASAIRYIQARYGDISKVQQANPNLPPKGYDSGGLLMPGYTMAFNGTGKPESIRTAEQEKNLQGALGGQHYHFAEGAIQVDASKLDSIADLVTMITKLQTTARTVQNRRPVRMGV